MDELILKKYSNKQEWEDYLINLGTLDRHVQFFIGDAILDGEEKKYIERGKYDRVAELTGIDKNSLRDYVYVCRKIESAGRLAQLEFYHHREVAKLEPNQQQYFLNEAIKNKWSVSKLREAIKRKEIEQTLIDRDINEIGNRPIIYHEDCNKFLTRFKPKSVDLLLTDPPYSTDIDNLSAFIESWLFDSLEKVKNTGRAFICIGAYPKELYSYLYYLIYNPEWIVDNPLIWTYRNTLGQIPKMKYNLNYQVILHLYKKTSTPLDNRITNEMFSVQDINAPDGRIGDRYHQWQKPKILADRLISHTTKPGDIVIDPFACTGTFILSANEKNRLAYGCDIDKSAIEIAVNRGCKLIENENEIRRIS